MSFSSDTASSILINIFVLRLLFPKVEDQQGVDKMCKHLRLSDWLFLQCLSRGMDNLNFKKVFENVVRKYSTGTWGITDEEEED